VDLGRGEIVSRLRLDSSLPIYAIFPLLCPKCGGAMRIIAVVTDPPTVRAILSTTA
jgi:hypothetical protein